MVHTSRKKHSVLSMGPGCDFISEDFLLDQLAPFGMSRRGVRSLCQALAVPLVHIGNTILVNINQFQIAFAAATRVGQQDFLVPGSDALRRGRKKNATTKLDPAYLAENWERVLEELVAARKKVGLDSRKFAKDVRAAVDALTLSTLQLLPSQVQAEYERTQSGQGESGRDSD